MSREDIIKDIKLTLTKPYRRTRTNAEDHINAIQAKLIYNKYYKRIADLQAKLAKSEESFLQRERKIEDLMLCEFVATTLDFNKLSADNCRLREQLAEKDAELEDLRKMRERFLKLKEQKPNEFELLNLRDDVDGLLKELAEKKKELKRIKKNWELSKGQQRRLYDSLKLRCKDVLEQVDQDKISFCIERLEKIKSELPTLAGLIQFDDYYIHNKRMAQYIDNQIKQLKENINA